MKILLRSCDLKIQKTRVAEVFSELKFISTHKIMFKMNPEQTFLSYIEGPVYIVMLQSQKRRPPSGGNVGRCGHTPRGW